MRKSGERADGGAETAGGARARRPGRPPRGADGAPPTRERILTEATALFARGGPQGVSMRDVAARVGIDVSSVHHHFATKTALYDACFARVHEREQRALAPLVDRLAAAVATGDRGKWPPPCTTWPTASWTSSRSIRTPPSCGCAAGWSRPATRRSTRRTRCRSTSGWSGCCSARRRAARCWSRPRT
ncbi:TetR/AcrR family transcriptional regulator [Streptomyces sp. AD16]|nr:TetR/AcrR family transcriptional regulator [Streptomyces sp. AD16]